MDTVPVGKKSVCIDDLRRRILTHELDPGSYLDEVEIGETYGISRPPVREVLRQLAGEGYVVLHENRGAQVAPMSHKTLRNFFIAAPMIYAAVARLAAHHASAPHRHRPGLARRQGARVAQGGLHRGIGRGKSLPRRMIDKEAKPRLASCPTSAFMLVS